MNTSPEVITTFVSCFLNAHDVLCVYHSVIRGEYVNVRCERNSCPWYQACKSHPPSLSCWGFLTVSKQLKKELEKSPTKPLTNVTTISKICHVHKSKTCASRDLCSKIRAYSFLFISIVIAGNVRYSFLSNVKNLYAPNHHDEDHEQEKRNNYSVFSFSCCCCANEKFVPS
jgi:hypothetical protein